MEADFRHFGTCAPSYRATAFGVRFEDDGMAGDREPPPDPAVRRHRDNPLILTEYFGNQGIPLRP